MHSYDLEGRGRVYAGTVVLSVALVWLLDRSLNLASVDPPWWLSAPSVAGFYTMLYWAFDRHVWRWRLIHRFGLLSLPDLNGQWSGEIDSSFGEAGIKTTVEVTILQRWSTMLVSLQTGESGSRSTVGALTAREIDNPELTYTYVSEPRGRATDTMQMHRGTCVLRLKGDVLQGTYYTSRGRGTVGELKLVRTK